MQYTSRKSPRCWTSGGRPLLPAQGKKKHAAKKTRMARGQAYRLDGRRGGRDGSARKDRARDRRLGPGPGAGHRLWAESTLESRPRIGEVGESNIYLWLHARDARFYARF